jgi:hypothetical protein
VKLHDTVQLVVDLPDEGLTAGAIGAVVHIFEQPDVAYEVEFADAAGRTIAQLPLTAEQLRPLD